MWNLWEEQDTEQQDTLVEQLHKAKKKTRTRLSNILVTKVALVDSPASGQRFCIAKRAPDLDEEREAAALLADVQKMDREEFGAFFAALDDDGQQKVLAIVEQAEQQQAALLKNIHAMTPAQYNRFLDSLSDADLNEVGALLYADLQKREKEGLLKVISKMTEQQFDRFFASLERADQDGVLELLNEQCQGV